MMDEQEEARKDHYSRVDMSNMSESDYERFWYNRKLEVKLVEKIGECPHNIGDTFIYENPNKRPENLCVAMLHAFEPYTWRTALGFPSWNEKDRSVFRIHCPDATGTIWEMRRLD